MTDEPRVSDKTLKQCVAFSAPATAKHHDALAADLLDARSELSRLREIERAAREVLRTIGREACPVCHFSDGHDLKCELIPLQAALDAPTESTEPYRRRWLDDPPPGVTAQQWDDVIDVHRLTQDPSYMECACGWRVDCWNSLVERSEDMGRRLGRIHRRNAVVPTPTESTEEGK